MFAFGQWDYAWFYWAYTHCTELIYTPLIDKEKIYSIFMLLLFIWLWYYYIYDIVYISRIIYHDNYICIFKLVKLMSLVDDDLIFSPEN